MRPAVFLDRDGTMIHEAGYLGRLEDLRWYPWTIEAIRLLNRAGLLVVVVTNQGGVGLGLFDEAFVGRVHDEMTKTIAAGGGRVDGWYYCPHHPRAVVETLRVDCDCRKPQPGMVRQAARDLGIDPARSFVVGDKMTDLGLAAAVGAKAAFVRTGHGEHELEQWSGPLPARARVTADLMEATSWILSECGPAAEPA